MKSTEQHPKIRVSVVIPVFNEEHVLPILLPRLIRVLETLTSSNASEGYEVVFVNDGSSDGSFEFLRKIAETNASVVVVNLSRNFGHGPAVAAGLSMAQGRAVVLMDADLQDPPELMPQLINMWKTGFQVVNAQRRSRQERGIRGLLIRSFHLFFQFLSEYPIPFDSGVYCLMDRVVVDQLNRFPERHRFLPGLRSWVGFRTTKVEYDRDERAAGCTKQSLWRLVNYSLDAIFSFSRKPLRLSFVAGLIISAVFFLIAFTLTILRLLHIHVVAGFTASTVSIMFLGGVQLIGIGILGECLGRIYEEVKNRPLYIISDVLKSSSPIRQDK